MPKPTSKQRRKAEAHRKQEAVLGRVFPGLSALLVNIHSILLRADIQLEYGAQTMENVINSYSLPLLTVAGLSVISSDSGESLGSLFEGLTFQWLHDERPLQCEKTNTFRTEIN